jgi:hypothetical protein
MAHRKLPLSDPKAAVRYRRDRARGPDPWLLLSVMLLVTLLVFYAAVTGALLFNGFIGSAPP